MNAKIVLFSVMASVIFLYGCSKEFLEPDGFDFIISESGEVTTSTEEVSWKEFSKKVDGHGWKQQKSLEILDDGTTKAPDIVAGIGYYNFYFKNTDITVFNMSFHYSKDTRPIKFEDSSFFVYDKIPVKVLKVSWNHFSFIIPLYFRDVNRDRILEPVYGYVVYEKMSSSELKDLFNRE